MALTEEQKKSLTEKLLQEEWFDESLCTVCGKADKIGFHAHYGNDYDAGKHDFEPQENHTFLTWDDLGACMEALVREGKLNEFLIFSSQHRAGFRLTGDSMPSYYTPSFIAWLFRPVNEAGEAHFFALVAEFLEVKARNEMDRTAAGRTHGGQG